MGEYTLPDDYKAAIQVIVNPDEKTLKFIDNGIGMTADEVEEYITQIAFSGATEFLEKYKDKTNSDQMIGHFGLGFYSAFMVADEVHIDSLPIKKDPPRYTGPVTEAPSTICPRAARQLLVPKSLCS